MTNWPTKKISECIQKLPKKSGIPLKQYLKKGKFPVIDQGQDFIDGYTDDSDLVYESVLPVIIFGDHTRAIKFIDFPFAVGADGTKVLKPIDFLDAKYFYFALMSLNIKSRGYARHFSILKEKEIPLPSIGEQKRVVARLEKLLAKIDEAKRLRAEALEAVQSLLPAELHKIFDDGKKKNWKNIELDKVCVQITDGTHNAPPYVILGIPMLDTKNIDDNFTIISTTATKFISKNTDKLLSKRCKPRTDDILISSRGTIGKIAIVQAGQDFNIMGNIILIRHNQNLISKFLAYFLKHMVGDINQVARGTSQKGLYLNKMRKYILPLPSLAEQKKIVARLDSLSEKVEKLKIYQQETASDLDALKQSILHQAFEAKL